MNINFKIINLVKYNIFYITYRNFNFKLNSNILYIIYIYYI